MSASPRLLYFCMLSNVFLCFPFNYQVLEYQQRAFKYHVDNSPKAQGGGVTCLKVTHCSVMADSGLRPAHPLLSLHTSFLCTFIIFWRRSLFPRSSPNAPFPLKLCSTPTASNDAPDVDSEHLPQRITAISWVSISHITMWTSQGQG